MARTSKEANRAYYRKYYAYNKKAIKRNQEKYEEKNPRVHVPDSSREIRLKYHYKMTVDQYEAQLALQGWHCALCPAVQGDDKRRMAVDHDHSCCPGHKTCGKCNRGILCANCNRRLATVEAVLKEGTIVPNKGTWLERAMRYLDSYKVYYTELRDDGYEIHNRHCTDGFSEIGEDGCICTSYKDSYNSVAPRGSA